MRDGIIIQARTGSTRLHNKILLPFYGEQRIIDILIGNIKQACAGKTIVLATTDRPQDDILEEVAREAGICCYRGDENNVLDRFVQAAAVQSRPLYPRLFGQSFSASGHFPGFLQGT